MSAFFSRIKLPVKLGLIAVLFAAPLALTSGILLSKDMAAISFLQKEKEGQAFIGKLWPALAANVDGKPAGTAELETLRRAVETKARAIDAESAARSFLDSSGDARAEGGSDVFEASRAGIEALNAAAAGSGLILDGDLASFYTISVLYDALPDLAVAAQDVARFAALEAAGEPGAANSRALALGALNSAISTAGSASVTAFGADKTGDLGRVLADPMRKVEASARALVGNIEAGAPIGEIAKTRTEMLAELSTAWRAGSSQLGIMLDRRVRALQASLLVTFSIVGVLILLAGGLMFVIARELTGAVTRLVARMNGLAAGDTEAVIPHGEDRNEMGEIARAVAVFRENLVEMRRLEVARKAAEAKAEADRLKLETDLRQGFGAVVDAARRGDFSLRAPESAELGGLIEIARGLNAVCISAESFLEEVDRAASALAEGDLTFSIPSRFEGKFSVVADNLNQAGAALSGTVSEVREAAEGANNASREIRQAADDLSGRAEQQAANLEETAAALEEMTASVKQNAENSVDAARSAEEASRRAETGGKIARDAVDAMARIEDSAKRIADIIGLIEGIAFQTNLLALNAAVEAVRAGEAGKGFAVVAAEVRTLAQRASDAAKDVKSLIQTSQTEVAAGARLVHSAGEMLDEIVASARKAAGMISGISTASREQAEAAGQISSAVAHLDQITQHNSSLAEQSAGAARGMSEEADRLTTLVARFRTGAETTAARPQRAALAKAVTGDARTLNARLSQALGARPVRAATPKPAPAKASGRGGAQPAAKQDILADDDWSEF